MNKTNHAASYLLVLAVVLVASPARAAIISWDGSLFSVNWDAGSPGSRNWDSSNLPLTTDDVAFPDTAADYFVNLNGDRTVVSAAFTGSADYTLNNSTLTLTSGNLTSTESGEHVINSNVVLGADGNWDIDTSAFLVNGNISGGFQLTKAGMASLNLQGANTYTGATSIDSGELHISGSDERLPDTTAVTIALGASLRLSDGITETIGSLAGGGDVLFSAGNTVLIVGADGTSTVFSGILDETDGGTSNLTKIGAGTLTLTGANTYAGGTTVGNGTLLLGNLDALGTGGLTINAGGTVDLDVNVRRIHGDIAINDGTLNLAGTTLDASGSDLSGTMPNHNLTVSGSTGLLNATGSALINLNGLNSDGASNGANGGSLLVSGGIFNLGPSATLSARGGSGASLSFSPGLAGSVSFSGGVSTLDGTITLEGQFTGFNGGNVTVSSAADVTLTGTMDLRGFKGRNGISFGGNGQDGGDGGMLLIQGGNFTLDASGAIVNLLPGIGGFGNNGGTDGLSGAPGSIDLSGGTLTLTAGVIRGGNSMLTLDPIHLIGSSINVNGGDLIATAAMTIRGNAAINLSAGSVTATTIKNISSNFNFTGGTFTVDTFLGSLTQDGGNLVPGASAGTTTIAVNYVMNAGTLAIELGGLLAGSEFDQLVVAGNATLGGLLDVSLINSFTPSFGDSFEIVNVGGSLTGTFSGLPQGALVGNFGGTDLFIDYTGGDGNDVALVATLAGDFDFDFGVVGNDFLLWQQNPTIGSLADWETNYGMVAPLSASSAAVPEPTTAMLLMLGMMGMIRRTSPRRDFYFN